MNGRRKPYTESGIRRLPCARCGRRAEHQWQICADGLWRPVCRACDVELNELVLRWFGFKDWRVMVRRYELCQRRLTPAVGA